MKKAIIPAVGLALLLTACSGSATPSKTATSHASASAPTPAATTTPTDTSMSTAAPSDDTSVGTVDLSPNWTALKQTIGGHGKDDWDGSCLTDISCSTKDPLDGSLITASFVDAPGAESITVSYLATDASDDTGAKLDLGHFALFFSTDSVSQFDFSQAVSDAIDATPVGESTVKTFDPVRLTVQHPTAAKWQFKVDQSPLS